MVFACCFSGQQVAVFRGQDGKAYVVDAYCPHLGANLAVGGRVVGGCIECPFHGWQFRGQDGKCVKIPYADKGETFFYYYKIIIKQIYLDKRVLSVYFLSSARVCQGALLAQL